MKEKLFEMQSRLKELATKIKKSKPNYYASCEARHLHMVYGILRGVPKEAIEAKCREPLQKYMFKKIEAKYELELDYDEIIRYSRSVLIS